MIRPGDLVRRRPVVALRWTYLSGKCSFPITRDQAYLVVSATERMALLLSHEGKVGWIDCEFIDRVPD